MSKLKLISEISGMLTCKIIKVIYIKYLLSTALFRFPYITNFNYVYNSQILYFHV